MRLRDIVALIILGIVVAVGQIMRAGPDAPAPPPPLAAAGHNQQRVLLHQRTTGKPGTTPSSHKGNALTMATGQDLGHLLSRFWQHRKLRHVPVHGETVTVVRQQFLAPCDD